MGWLALFAIQPLFQNLPNEGLFLLVAGGLSYSIGVVFFLWEKLPFSHAIWHLFVLGGSVCHFFAVAMYVM
jgi:hemolysin III